MSAEELIEYRTLISTSSCSSDDKYTIYDAIDKRLNKVSPSSSLVENGELSTGDLQ